MNLTLHVADIKDPEITEEVVLRETNAAHEEAEARCGPQALGCSAFVFTGKGIEMLEPELVNKWAFPVEALPPLRTQLAQMTQPLAVVHVSEDARRAKPGIRLVH